MSKPKIIYFVNEEKDEKIILQAMKKNEIFLWNYQLAELEIEQNLAREICEIIKEDFEKVISSKSYSHMREFYSGAYQSVVNSLVFRWSYQVGEIDLLQMWTELGIKLARSQCFTNGNKRTAFLSLISFIKRCGFDLEINDKEWEELFIKVATSEEKHSLHLLKEKILNNIRINHD